MKYKDIVFEQYKAARFLLIHGQLYAANTLLCACWELIQHSYCIARRKRSEDLKRYLLAGMGEDLFSQGYSEMKTNGGFPDLSFEEYKLKMEQVIDALAKKFAGTVDFSSIEENIRINWDIYNRSKHGLRRGESGRLDLEFRINNALSTQQVENMEMYVRGALIVLYPDDVKSYFNL